MSVQTRHARLTALLNDALDQPPESRQAYLDRECGNDTALRAELESLLTYGEADGVLATPLFDLREVVGELRGASIDRALSSNMVLQASATARDSKSPFFWLALALGAVFIVLLAGTGWRIARHGDAVKHFGWSEEHSRGAWRVATVDDRDPIGNAPHVGDRILAFDGDPRAALIGTESYRSFLAFGAGYTLRVVGPDGEHERVMRLGPPVPGAALVAATYCVLAVSFCAMGLVIGLSRPRDRITQIGCLAGWLAALRLLGLGVARYRGGDSVERAFDALLWLCEPWHLALSYHFLYLFARPPSSARIWRVLNIAIYVMCAVLFALSIALRIATLAGREATIALQVAFPLMRWLHTAFIRSNLWDVFQLIVYTAISAVLLHGYRSAEDLDRQRRIRWVVFGCLMAFGPLLVLLVADFVLQAFHRQIVDSAEWKTVEDIVNACLLAVPVTLAYAVAKHHVLGIRVIVRRSVQRALAARVFQVVLLLLIVALVTPIARNANRQDRPLYPGRSLYWNLLLVGIVAIGFAQRHRLNRWLDRKFFREFYVQEKLLSATMARLKDSRSVTEVVRVLAEMLSTAFHPSFLCHVNQETPGGSFVIRGANVADVQAVKQLARATMQRLVWDAGRTPLPAFAVTDGDVSALAVPVVAGGGRSIGCLFLGDKLSDEPYGEHDRDLLIGIADQIAVVQEKLWLRMQVDDAQRLQRRVLGQLPGSSINLVRECPRCRTCFDSVVEYCTGDGERLTCELPVEREITGRYRLDRRCGEGGMGVVFEATDLVLEQPVAIKVTRAEMFTDRSAVRRFEREAIALARVRHRNVVPVSDWGEPRTGGAYLVMKRVDGRTWRAHLQTRRPLPVMTVADWMDQLLCGLQAAHDQHVVHRDLKPENVIVTTEPDGREHLTLVDFGLAVMIDRSTSLTLPGTVLGTLDYMSPEQSKAAGCDERSDVFAAAVMALEALSGKHPRLWPSRDAAAVATVLPRFACAAPARDRLDAVMMECLAEDPSGRVRTAAEMRARLSPALRACG